MQHVKERSIVPPPQKVKDLNKNAANSLDVRVSYTRVCSLYIIYHRYLVKKINKNNFIRGKFNE